MSGPFLCYCSKGRIIDGFNSNFTFLWEILPLENQINAYDDLIFEY